MSLKQILLLNLFITAFITVSCTQKTDSLSDRSQIAISENSYRGPVERSLKLEFSYRPDRETDITARISSAVDYTQPFDFTWQLGPGIELISGSLQGHIQQIKKDRPVEIIIKVKGLIKEENRHVRFEILGEQNHRRIFADGIVSSQQEKSFEKLVQDIEKWKAENE